MSTINFTELKYYSFGDVAKKKLENREVIIHKNIGLGSKRFVIKYEKLEKKFYITFDYRTLDDKDGEVILNTYQENLKNIVDYFDNNIIHLYGVICDKKIYFHTIYLNNNFFDYEDSKTILDCFGFNTDQIVYSGKYDEKVLKEFISIFGTVSLISKNQTIEEKSEPPFYIVKFEKIADQEVKDCYKSIIDKFISDRIENETGIEMLKLLIEKVSNGAITKENENLIKTGKVIPYIYDVYKIELLHLVKENKLVLTVFDKMLRTEICRVIDSYFKKI